MRAMVAAGSSPCTRARSMARRSRHLHVDGGVRLGGRDQLLDQRELAAGVTLDHLEPMFDLMWRDRPQAQTLRSAEDCVERRPQFVGDWRPGKLFL